MLLFRVDQEWTLDPETREPLLPIEERRVIIRQGKEGPGIYFNEDGEEPLLALPVDEELAAPFADPELEQMQLIAARLAGKKGDPKELALPSRQELGRITGGDYFGPCLVHICIPVETGGRLWFEAVTFEEVVVPQGRTHRVEWRYHPVDQSTGLGYRYLNKEGTEGLFEMWKGSSLRIHRDEETLPQGQVPVLTVKYSGTRLDTVRPAERPRQSQRPRGRPQTDLVRRAYAP